MYNQRRGSTEGNDIFQQSFVFAAFPNQDSKNRSTNFNAYGEKTRKYPPPWIAQGGNYPAPKPRHHKASFNESPAEARAKNEKGLFNEPYNKHVYDDNSTTASSQGPRKESEMDFLDNFLVVVQGKVFDGQKSSRCPDTKFASANTCKPPEPTLLSVPGF